MEASKVLASIRKAVGQNVGQRVEVTAHRGRKRAQVSKGTLDAVYPSIFTVVVQDAPGIEHKLSFSYNDVLTRTVELILVEHGEPLTIELQSSTN